MIFCYQLLSNVVSILKNDKYTLRFKIAEMKAHVFFSQLSPMNIVFFADFINHKSCLLNPLKSENRGDKGSSRFSAVKRQRVHI